MSRASIAAVIVAYGDAEAVKQSVAAVKSQSRAPEEIVVVDNHPLQATRLLFELEAGVVAVANPANTGYAGGNKLGAKSTSCDYLLFINPDAQADSELCAALAAELDADQSVAIAGAQILLRDGRCNAGENPLHITGLSWSGGWKQPREHGPARDALVVSGACLMVRASAFRDLGGFSLPYFLYSEDTDLCWRARLLGGRVRFVPEAVATHDYDFSKGHAKWRYLERNRLLMILSNYEATTLLKLAPVLLVTELALWVVAWRAGWAKQKRLAYRDLLSRSGWLRRQRRSVQRQRAVSDKVLLTEMTGDLTSSPLMTGRLARLASACYERYRQALI